MKGENARIFNHEIPFIISRIVQHGTEGNFDQKGVTNTCLGLILNGKTFKLFDSSTTKETGFRILKVVARDSFRSAILLGQRITDEDLDLHETLTQGKGE